MFKNLNDLATILRLVDDIQRLGIDRHFGVEIEVSLFRFKNEFKASDNIQIVALGFRLLRQQGYNVSSDVFNQFKDEEGKLQQELICDAKGLLYLYEASWLGSREDMILDEAMVFARGHLENLVAQTDNSVLASQIACALEIPFHLCMMRLQSRRYIASYRDGKASSHALLELAKLDANLLQSLHQSELKALSQWYREMGFLEKFSFCRDRLVESYFWSVGGHFEPQYSQGRLLVTKLVVLVTLTDDMFDAYGTLEELQLVKM